MPNKNYQKGVRFERERKKHYEDLGHTVIRASGSHGPFDLVVIDPKHAICTLVQCKVTTSQATADRLISAFRQSPPFVPMKSIHQRIEVKVLNAGLDGITV